jgi:hypothetical protein
VFEALMEAVKTRSLGQISHAFYEVGGGASAQHVARSSGVLGARGVPGVPSRTKPIHHPVVILSAAKDLVIQSPAEADHDQADHNRTAGRH